MPNKKILIQEVPPETIKIKDAEPGTIFVFPKGKALNMVLKPMGDTLSNYVLNKNVILIASLDTGIVSGVPSHREIIKAVNVSIVANAPSRPAGY